MGAQNEPISVAPFDAGQREQMVLILAPTGRDTQLTCALLQERASIQCQPSATIAELCAGIRKGVGAVIIAEEALDLSASKRLLEALGEQLPWSDLPVLVLANNTDMGIGSPTAMLQQSGNVTVLERPVRILTLLTAVQSALRARRRQYEVRDLLIDARNAIRQRDQFLAMLGHELRNPLGAISNSLTVIDAASGARSELETEQREIIRRQTDHLARLVDDLLDVSRITSGKVTLQRTALDLCDVARRCCRLLEAAADARGHRLTTEIACKPIWIDADPVRMEQIINNLLTNAIKYTPAGGLIRLSLHAQGEHAVLRVNDTGMGISAELLPRVFDLFTQSERALDRSQGGLGIGLTLVRSLVEMHDGTVLATSAGMGKGSEFTIVLPLMQQQAPIPSAGDNASVSLDAKKSEGHSILVIEDQADARRALQRLLQIWGHQVAVAADGPNGVEAAVSMHPDVALVDVGLPGLDGYEVARQIRKSLGDEIRLIALTGYGQPEDRDRALAAGFDVHLVKPVDHEALERSLAQVHSKA